MIRTDREALMRNAHDCQAQALGLLADEAADGGDDQLEAGYRWMAANRCWPMARVLGIDGSDQREVWYWTHEDARHPPLQGWRDANMLPWGTRSHSFTPGVGSNEFAPVLEWGARVIGKWRMSEFGGN